MIENLHTLEDDLNSKLSRLRDGEPLRVIDLFAGCGGMSLGFKRASYNILGGVELNAQAAKTHTLNFFRNSNALEQELHSEPRDITELTPALFLKEILHIQSPFNQIDVIVGGPPCQAFARIGRAKLREIMKHPEAFLQDERANLYINFLEYVEFFKPLAVVMENVPDIMNFGGQNVAEEIAASLDSLHYRVKYTILNSVHYGVPQLRQRFYLVALRDELDINPKFPDPIHYFDLPQGYKNAHQVALGGINLFNIQSGHHYVTPPISSINLPRAVTAMEALSDLPSITAHLRGESKRGMRNFNTLTRYREGIEISNFSNDMRNWPGFESQEGVYDHVTRNLPRDYQIFAQMEPGDQYPEAYKIATKILENNLFQYERTSGQKLLPDSKEYSELKAKIVPPYDPGKFPNKWRKMEPDQPSRTLTAHIGKDTYSHIHYDSEQARVISVREAARLQSFPDGFKFSGSMNSAFRQIGNAVPPLQAYALAKTIRDMIITSVNQNLKLAIK